jgi:hypothetical protein
MEEPELDEARERLVRATSWCSGPGSTPLPERARLMALACVSVSARLPVKGLCPLARELGGSSGERRSMGRR